MNTLENWTPPPEQPPQEEPSCSDLTMPGGVSKDDSTTVNVVGTN